MSRLSPILFFLFLTRVLCAQIIQNERFEVPLENEGPFEVVSSGKDGLFLYQRIVSQSNEATGVWKVAHLDTSFDVKWVKLYSLGADYELVDHYYNDGRVFLLFNNFASKNRNLELMSWDMEGELLRVPIRNYIPFSYFDFTATQEAVVIAGYFNYRPIVVLYSYIDRVPRVLPGIFNEKSIISDIKINDNQTFDVTVAGRTIDKKNTLFVNTFDFEGNIVKKVALDTDRTKSLLFGRTQQMENSAQLVAGVYGRYNSEYSRGLFVYSLNRFGEQKQKFYNYAELKNFFNYMRAGRERRVKNRIERRKIKGKKIKFNYRFLVHDLIEYDSQYVLLGEAFYPKYRNVSGGSGGNFFNPIGTNINRGLYNSSLVFEGYRYTHAVVMGFDKSGDLLWDNSFEINDVISPELEQFVHAAKSGDNIALLYVYDNQIRSKVIMENDVVEGKELIDVELKYKGDRTAEGQTNLLGIDKWYDNTFFVYGTQRVINTTNEGVEPSREVFFINKVEYK
ncbi:MAG: hypothetical protein AAGF85_04290 [Bacteroidota bacterium]